MTRYKMISIRLPEKWWHKLFRIEPGIITHMVKIEPDEYEKAQFEKVIVFGKDAFDLRNMMEK